MTCVTCGLPLPMEWSGGYCGPECRPNWRERAEKAEARCLYVCQRGASPSDGSRIAAVERVETIAREGTAPAPPRPLTDQCGVCAQPTTNQNHEAVGAGLPPEPTCDECLAAEVAP